jgi:hypothetical protein
MEAGRREQERQRVLDLAAWVWALTSEDGVSEWEQAQYIRFGSLPAGGECPAPHIPGLEEKIREIEENGGRLIVK